MDFIIIGGGCYGTFYARQLLRGADRIKFNQIHVVDHDPECQTRRELGSLSDPRLILHVEDWKSFLSPYFDDVVERYRRGEILEDQYVPPTFAPHILLELFLEKAMRETPNLSFEKKPLEGSIGTPVDIPLPAGTRALSFATWRCPHSCIEPPTCPHTRGPKDWDMKEYLDGLIEVGAHGGVPLQSIDSLHTLQCRHYGMGVGTIPVKKIAEEYIQFQKVVGVPGTKRVAMATVSSCHGLIGLVESHYV